MSDVVWHAKIGVSGVVNGSIVAGCLQTGEYKRANPPVNITIPSGTLFTKYKDRFENFGSPQ
jgi:hypothetical protein